MQALHFVIAPRNGYQPAEASWWKLFLDVPGVLSVRPGPSLRRIRFAAKSGEVADAVRAKAGKNFLVEPVQTLTPD